MTPSRLDSIVKYIKNIITLDILKKHSAIINTVPFSFSIQYKKEKPFK